MFAKCMVRQYNNNIARCFKRYLNIQFYVSILKVLIYVFSGFEFFSTKYCFCSISSHHNQDPIKLIKSIFLVVSYVIKLTQLQFLFAQESFYKFSQVKIKLKFSMKSKIFKILPYQIVLTKSFISYLFFQFFEQL